ncbi:MAG TPA: alpha-L-rhamnosidase C-terminal domain-containing protein [Sedimentisphaerales bacterium]|nr:alpha-L-rhamnosidase C-terminal domain-containing protein [Sedimentisphaerales bacterium]
MKLKFILSAILMCGGCVCFADSGLLAWPERLTCQLFTSPEKTFITSANPVLGWVVNSNRNDDYQSAYQIVLCEGENVLYDSGKVVSSQSTNIRYSGAGLKSNSQYGWKVRIWNREDKASEWSKEQIIKTAEVSGEYKTDRYKLETTEVAPVRIVNKPEFRSSFIDFGRAGFGTVKLTLNSPAKGWVVDVHLGELKTSDDFVNTTPGDYRRYRKMELVLEKGTHTYTVDITPDKRNTTGPGCIKMPEYIGEVMPFRYCQITNLPEQVIRADMVRQVVVNYPFDDQGCYFRSSDSILNDVWELCRYSMKATSFCGTFVDGDRERIPYEADAYINQLGYYYCGGEYTICRGSLEHLIMNATDPTEWLLQSVLMAWEDHVQTGNSDSLEHFYKDLQAKTLIALAREDGLISTRTGLGSEEFFKSLHFIGSYSRPDDIVDWPHGGANSLGGAFGETDGYEFTNINTAVNAFHYRAIVLMSKIAKVLGKNEDADFYGKRAELVKESINQKLFDKSKGIYVDGEGSGHSSLHANMFALALGVVAEENEKTVAEFVKSRGMVCSVYGAQYLLEALYEAEMGEYALELMLKTDERSWANMIYGLKSTITTEAWDNKYKYNQDYNHAWGGAPANIIARKLMGVEPLEAGFGKIRIKPQPGNLEWASFKTTTIKGPIYVDLKQERGKRFELEINIPTNTRADVFVPALNNKGVISFDGKKTEGKLEGEFLLMQDVGSGKHFFEVSCF